MYASTLKNKRKPVYEWEFPPTKGELKILDSLLRDFGIHTSIPAFTSRIEMRRWRKYIIIKHLEDKE